MRKFNYFLKYIGSLILILAFFLFLGILFFFSNFSFEKKVAVLNIDGEITTQSIPPSLFSEGKPGSEEIAETIKSLEDRNDIGAVVIVVNSPGGSVVASREIYNAIKNLSKPKVVYFREVAASGAYYLSTPADYIISDPDAITGSIGVITEFSDFSDLLGNLGINFTAIKSGSSKDIGSSTRHMSEKEKQIIQHMVDEVFDEFKTVVIENRGDKLNMQKFNEILDGRIVLGRDAKEIGLVDAIGTKQDAINKAAELANITNPEVENIEIAQEDNSLFGVRSLIGGLLAFHPQKTISVKYEIQ